MFKKLNIKKSMACWIVSGTFTHDMIEWSIFTACQRLGLFYA